MDSYHSLEGSKELSYFRTCVRLERQPCLLHTAPEIPSASQQQAKQWQGTYTLPPSFTITGLCGRIGNPDASQAYFSFSTYIPSISMLVLHRC